jgi:hypothetical protein
VIDTRWPDATSQPFEQFGAEQRLEQTCAACWLGRRANWRFDALTAYQAAEKSLRGKSIVLTNRRRPACAAPLRIRVDCLIHYSRGADTVEPSDEKDPRACARCPGRAEPRWGSSQSEGRPSIAAEQLLIAVLLQCCTASGRNDSCWISGLQSFVPVVCGAFARRPQPYQESRAA